MLTRDAVNVIKGKLMSNGDLTTEECNEIIIYMNEIETILDNLDMDDVLGSEGWRAYLGMED